MKWFSSVKKKLVQLLKLQDYLKIPIDATEHVETYFTDAGTYDVFRLEGTGLAFVIKVDTLEVVAVKLNGKYIYNS